MLRSRILFGVTPLLILLMVIGSYAVWLFVRLGGAVTTTSHENYTSIVTMRDLKDRATRIDQAFPTNRAGGATLPQTRSVVGEESIQRRRGVDAELTISTEPGERATANRLKVKDESFLTMATAARSQRLDAEAKLSSTPGSLLDAASDVLVINERAIAQEGPRAGTGPGLAICRELIGAHDGEIGGVAAPGRRGSEFFFKRPTAVPVAQLIPSRT